MTYKPSVFKTFYNHVIYFIFETHDIEIILNDEVTKENFIIKFYLFNINFKHSKIKQLIKLTIF